MHVAATNLKGGDTNFPILDTPRDEWWYAYMDSDESGENGITFGPVLGNVVFWQNLRGDSSGDLVTLHAGLPVSNGVKVGDGYLSELRPLSKPTMLSMGHFSPIKPRIDGVRAGIYGVAEAVGFTEHRQNTTSHRREASQQLTSRPAKRGRIIEGIKGTNLGLRETQHTPDMRRMEPETYGHLLRLAVISCPANSSLGRPLWRIRFQANRGHILSLSRLFRIRKAIVCVSRILLRI